MSRRLNATYEEIDTQNNLSKAGNDLNALLCTQRVLGSDLLYPNHTLFPVMFELPLPVSYRQWKLRIGCDASKECIVCLTEAMLSLVSASMIARRPREGKEKRETG